MLGWCIAGVWQPARAEETQLSYNQDVRPILSDKCFACHGPDEKAREAGLRLDSFDAATEDRGGYVAIAAGDPDGSEAIRRILSTDDDRMPPPDSHKTLTDKEIETLKAWVAQGAPYERHWAYRPLVRPQIPQVESESYPTAIDAFLQDKLRKHGLPVALPADKTTLARRLYLDLLGVPPKPIEVDAFVKDSSPDAYERLVDRLLADPRFGERMAVFWLDLVRYADTIGYHSDNFMEVSAYRDYVIATFNDNKPFNQFTIEQLAGDLLPHATREQLVASGYNRLLQTTEEGGAQPKEYTAIYAADRVRNVSEVWLGATMGCAQCHDHKYDPYTQHDFYSMAAFFADITEQPIGARDPNLLLPTPEQEARLAEIRRKIDRLQLDQVLTQRPKLLKAVDRGQRDWEQRLMQDIENDDIMWTSPRPARYAIRNSRMKLDLLADNSLLVSNARPYEAIYDVDMRVSGAIRAVRLEALTHPTFRSEGRFSNNRHDFVLTEFRLKLDDQPIAISKATAEFEQPGFPIAQAIDGNEKTGWAIAGHPRKERIAAVFTLAEPLQLGSRGKKLRVTLVHRSIFGRHYIGRFRIGTTAKPSATVDAPDAVPHDVIEAVLAPRISRTSLQQQRVQDYYRTFAPELDKWRSEINRRIKEEVKLKETFQTTLIAEALAEPRVVRVLPRGNWQDDSGEIVEPNVPEFLPHGLPDDRRLTRLDLARWITSRDNPLAARTFVNRLWKLFYGCGLSRNLGDLGGQGEPPTHPDLLDWLAAEFRNSGWDVKQLVRKLVTTDAYRRSSVPSATLRTQDHTNQWYGRQNRWRLEAEFVRDSALDISGLLDVSRIGGRSAKPYQPAGYWQHLNFPPREWRQSKGNDLYRRSLYTYWCRTFLHPAMLAFDAPSREECTAQRARSNIPQQALVLLNDPIFVEAARVFAARIAMREGTVREKAVWAMRQAMLRTPELAEIDVLEKLYADQQESFSASPEEATKLISVGAAAVPQNIDPLEFAAWTQVTRTLLAAYETTSRF